jgi:phosphosulfolactate synthase (CoM biosynthesis protein A)
MPTAKVRELIEVAHRHNVLVWTGRFIKHVLTEGPSQVNRYIDECQAMGFDILENFEWVHLDSDGGLVAVGG